MSYESLKTAIEDVITTNGNGEITGAILRVLLTNNIVPILGESHYKGIAVAATNPGTPEYDVFYLATTAGTYSNFGGASLNAGLSILAYSTSGASWSAVQLIDTDLYLTKGGYGNTAQDLADSITANAGDISTNASDIATNASNISTNTSNISTNASDIATNASNIATNASNISGLSSSVGNNTGNISTNTTDIAGKLDKGSYEGLDAAALDNSIQTNTGNISTNTSNIATNVSDIAALEVLTDATIPLFKAVSINSSAEAGDFMLVTTGGDPKTMTLNEGPTLNDVVRVTIADSGGGTVTIDGNGFNINGSGTQNFSTQYEVKTLQFTGSEWVMW